MSHDHNPSIIYLGLDVAKSELVLDAARFGGLAKVKNTAVGHAKVVAAVRALASPTCLPHLVLEASGGYERTLVAALHAASLRVSVVNPGRVRYHALSKGLIAKTDALDASLLSDFGQERKPVPTPPVSANQQALSELTARRLQLIDLRTQESNRAEHHLLPAIAQEAQDLRAVLDAHLARIDAELEALRLADAALATKVERLCQVQGVGEVTALSILATIPELGTLNRQQVAALAGLAPFARESGKWKGQRRIGGGRLQARRALYMAAFTATRYNPILKPHFAHLRLRGKPYKVALCAVMRRLLIVFNSLLKDPAFQLSTAALPQPAPSLKGAKKCSP
jgi:transposase